MEALAEEAYTFTAKRYTYSYTRPACSFDHGGVREEGIVYGNGNVNVKDEDTGQRSGEANGQSLRFVAVPHLVVGRRSVHVHSEAVHVLVHETGMQLDHEKKKTSCTGTRTRT
jgi:hypothetical protein